MGWTVDEASPVVIQDGAEGRGRVARPDLILALLIDLEFLIGKSQVLIVFLIVHLNIVHATEHPPQHGVWMLSKQGRLHYKPRVTESIS